jgi:hypothetical protein
MAMMNLAKVLEIPDNLKKDTSLVEEDHVVSYLPSHF